MSHLRCAILFFKSVVISLVFFQGSFFVVPVFATTSSCNTNMNIGTYIQTAPTAGVTLNYNSNTSGRTGLSPVSSSNPTAGGISFTGTGTRDNVSDLIVLEKSVALTRRGGGGVCNIVVNNFKLQNNSLQIWLGMTNTVGLGATLSISGDFCEAGTYEGTARIQYSWVEYSYFIILYESDSGTGTVSVPISVTLEDSLSIEKTHDMNFGTILSPNTVSTVKINTNDTYETSGDIHFTDRNVTAGRFKVTGVAGRNVHLYLPASATLESKAGDTMTVNNFTSDVTSPFILTGNGTSAIKELNVGGTLHINSRQKPGDYSGYYNVTVTY